MRLSILILIVIFLRPNPQVQQFPPWMDFWLNAVGPATNPYPLGWQDPKNGWILPSDPRAHPGG